MKLALGLGARGLGNVWPNPAVGCVLVRGARVVGRGSTQAGGRPHAEIVALEMAGKLASGATAYVTLEPCAHQGETGPCAEALAEAGVARVVISARDPDPRVNGQGIAHLAERGIAVTEAVCEAEARATHCGFFSKVERGRPYLTLKLATSLDGRIATGTGHSQWITGPLARRQVHLMRARHDAVLVGAGTARDDLPSLTVRDLGEMPSPVRVVLSNRLDLPRRSPLAQTARDVPVWLLHGRDVDAERLAFWTEAGARCFEVPTVSGGRLDVRACLQLCAREGLTRVLCEGGGQLAASLLQEDCVDRFVQFTGGVAIGAEGYPALGALGLAELREARRFHLMSVRRLDGDVQAIWGRT